MIINVCIYIHINTYIEDALGIGRKGRAAAGSFTSPDSNVIYQDINGVYIYIYIYTHTYVYVCIYIYIYTHIHMHLHMHIHIHILLYDTVYYNIISRSMIQHYMI